MESNIIQVNIQLPDDKLVENCPISPETTVDNVLKDLQSVFNLPTQTTDNQPVIYALVRAEKILPLKKTLIESGIKEGDLLKIVSLLKLENLPNQSLAANPSVDTHPEALEEFASFNINSPGNALPPTSFQSLQANEIEYPLISSEKPGDSQASDFDDVQSETIGINLIIADKGLQEFEIFRRDMKVSDVIEYAAGKYKLDRIDDWEALNNFRLTSQFLGGVLDKNRTLEELKIPLT